MADRRLESLVAGNVVTGPDRRMTAARLRAFSGGPLDREPWPARNLHTDADAAKAAGLSAPIASGIQPQCHLVALLVDLFDDDWFRYGELDLRFLKPVFADDTVTPHLRLLARMDDAGTASFEFEAWCARGDGEAVVSGTAKCRAVPGGGR
ncbi:MAG: MaoC family dehydratase [Acetobacterales bacterium]